MLCSSRMAVAASPRVSAAGGSIAWRRAERRAAGGTWPNAVPVSAATAQAAIVAMRRAALTGAANRWRSQANRRHR